MLITPITWFALPAKHGYFYIFIPTAICLLLMPGNPIAGKLQLALLFAHDFDCYPQTFFKPILLTLNIYFMTKIFRNKRLIIVAFFTVFSIGSASVALANDKNDLPVELKFIGTVKDQPLFQLSFAGNAEENDFTIIIRDEDGNSLYSENIKGENFYKKFLLNNEGTNDETLRFEIKSKRSNKIVVFEVNGQSRLVEEIGLSQVN
jgi:hypothetical protein